MENIEKTKKVIRISIKKTVALVVIVGMIVIVLFILGFFRPHRIFNTTSLPPVEMDYQSGSSNNLDSKMMEAPTYYPYNEGTATIEDTREFLKTSYSAQIKTRNVKDILRDVKSIINEMDGRIDNFNENSKGGYVRFVVPKSNFENFKNEIESITHLKLITENISSVNLLSQKQTIEEQQASATNLLAELEQQQKDLTTKHAQTKNKLQSEITTLENLLYAMDPPPGGFSEEDLAFRQNLSNNITQKKQKLASENSSFNTKNENLKNQIKNASAQIENANNQDTKFTNNIETVSGSISVTWISLWKLVKTFSPISPTLIIIILVIILWYILKRKDYLPRVEFV